MLKAAPAFVVGATKFTREKEPTTHLISPEKMTFSPKRFCTFSRRISAIASGGEVARDEEADGAGQDHHERVGVEVELERLQT